MSPTDKIVSFKISSAPKPLDPLVPEAEVAPLTETEAAVVDMAMFLLDNKDKIQNFICGVACATDTVEDDEIDTEFHLITSPIDARDYALALRLFEDGFRRNLEQVIEE